MADNWFCKECSRDTTTLYTIREWCDEYNITNDEDISYLEYLADKNNIESDICEKCFKSLLNSSSINFSNLTKRLQAIIL